VSFEQVEQAEQIQLDPNMLEVPSFLWRLGEAVTMDKFDRLWKNMVSTGLVGRYLGTSHPFDAFQERMDTIAEPTRAYPSETDLPGTIGSLLIVCTKGAGRDGLYDFAEEALLGIPPSHAPRFRTKGRLGLEMQGARHPHIATVGRIGSGALLKQYGPSGPSIRDVFHSDIGQIDARNINRLLPPKLKDQIATLRLVRGIKAAKTLLSSGGWAFVGDEGRRVLPPEFWDLQLPRGKRPIIEEDLHVHPRGGTGLSMLVSGSTPFRDVVDVLGDRAFDLKAPYQKRNWREAGEELWGILQEAGLTAGVGTIFSALGAVGKGTYHAIGTAERDRRLRRQLARSNG